MERADQCTDDAAAGEYRDPESGRDRKCTMEKAKAFTAKLKEQGAKEWAKEAKKKKK